MILLVILSNILIPIIIAKTTTKDNYMYRYDAEHDYFGISDAEHALHS